MKKVEYPCKNCKDRKIGCHAECGKYITVKESREKARQERFKGIETSDALYELHGRRLKSFRNGHK